MHSDSPITTIVCETLQYDRLPDWHEFEAAAWATEDSIKRAAGDVPRTQ